MVRQNGGRRGSKVAEDRLASRNETLPRPRSFEVAIHLPTNNEITNSPLPSDEIVKPAKNNTSRVTYLRIRNRGLNIPCPGLPGTNERKRLLLTGEIATARACVRARLFRRRRRREGRAIERYRKLELDRERKRRLLLEHMYTTLTGTRASSVAVSTGRRRRRESLVRATRFCRTATTPAFSAISIHRRSGSLGIAAR